MREYIDAIVWFAKDIAEGFHNARRQRETDRKIAAMRQALHEDGEVVSLTDADVRRILTEGRCRGEVIGDYKEAA